jgi:non-specific serine/threonine protein kinase
VPSLAIPDAEQASALVRSSDYGAIALFVDRAATTLGSFEPTGEDAALVLQLCQRLDGIPLAIELAAGKLNVLTLEQITRRLDDRFRLLTGGSRTALPRQKTLEATLDWSYELLSEAERALLRTLSAFAGGFTLEAAEAVCPCQEVEIGHVLETLSRLVDKSLVSTVSKNREVRYYLLETVRQYAYWKLKIAGDHSDVQRRHRDWFLTLAERAESQLRGPDQVICFERIEMELDNLRTAFVWSLENGETDEGARLACAISYFWEFEGHITEGRQWFARLMPKTPDEPSRLWTRATAWAAHLAGEQYDYEVSIHLAEQSLVAARALEDQSAIAFSLIALGNAYMVRDNLEKATEAYREGLHHSRASANKADIARSLGKLGQAAWVAGSYADAAGFLEESIDLNREIGDRWRLGVVQGMLASVELSQGKLSAARQLLADSLIPLQAVNDEYGLCLAVYKLGIVARCEKDYLQAAHFVERAIEPLRKLGERVLVNYCLCELGIVYGLQGKRQEAIFTLKKSAEDVLEVGDRWGLSKCLEALAIVLRKAGERKQAARFFGAAEAIREEIRVPLESYEQTDHDPQVQALHAGRDRDLIRKEWRAGRTMPIRDLISSLPETLNDHVSAVTKTERERQLSTADERP